LDVIDSTTLERVRWWGGENFTAGTRHACASTQKLRSVLMVKFSLQQPPILHSSSDRLAHVCKVLPPRLDLRENLFLNSFFMAEEANFKTTNIKIQNSNDVRIDEFAKSKTCNDARADEDFTTTNSSAKNCVTDVNCNTAWTDATNHALTDDHLFHLCKKYGENVRLWRQKFAGLLPEVFHRKLYEKKGFGSIFEFAAKLAGMSQEQVRIVLNLERKFEDKPVLKNLLIGGKVSANKLVRIASIATAENQMDLANYVQVLSKNAIETFVKDEKRAMNNDFMSGSAAGTDAKTDSVFENQNGLQEPLFNDKSLPGHSNLQSKGADVKSPQNLGAVEKEEQLALLKSKKPASKPILYYIKILESLSEETKNELLNLVKKGISIEKLIAQTLQNRAAEIARAKEEIATEIYGGDVEKEQLSAGIAQREAEIKKVVNGGVCDNSEAHAKIGGDVEKEAVAPSRYIPAKIRKIINEEQGDKCSVPNCKNRAQVTHHELPFAIARNHDPRNLQKLCKAHHELKHMVDVRFYEAREMAVSSA
jgi:hypothetical protein